MLTFISTCINTKINFQKENPPVSYGHSQNAGGMMEHICSVYGAILSTAILLVSSQVNYNLDVYYRKICPIAVASDLSYSLLKCRVDSSFELFSSLSTNAMVRLKLSAFTNKLPSVIQKILPVSSSRCLSMRCARQSLLSLYR